MDPRPIDLTSQANPNRLGLRGNIFMADGATGGPEHGQPSEPNVQEQRASVDPRKLAPERMARAQELLASLNKPGENASLAERRSYEMAQKAIMDIFGIPTIEGGSPDRPNEQRAEPQEEIDLDEAKRTIEDYARRSGQHVDTGSMSPDEIRRLAGQIAMQKAEEVGGSYNLYLTSKDRRMLEDKPMDWLESKFDMIYSIAREGQELNSPIVSQLQQIFTFAANYLVEKNADPKQIEAFSSSFLTRLNLIFMRSAIEHRNMESASEMAQRLQAHGLFAALAMEDGNVNRVFSRMAEFLEDKRLAQQKIVDELEKTGKEYKQTYRRIRWMWYLRDKGILNSEEVGQKERDLIAKQIDLAVRSKGDYGKDYDKAIGEGNNAEEAKEIVSLRIRSTVGDFRRLEVNTREFHITAEMMSHLQEDLIEEQLGLAGNGVGQYKGTYDSAKAAVQREEGEIQRRLKAEGKSPVEIEQEIKNLIKVNARKDAEPQIKRSVRTAYDVLVVSQRQGVIVARGHRLSGSVENYLSDPSGLFNVYNYEDLLTSKFNIFNKHADEFLTELKRNIAVSKLEKLGVDPTTLSEEELLDYGKRMFRDLFAVPDFFSSGWRIHGIRKGIRDSIVYKNSRLPEEQRMSEDKVEEKVKEFGLFLQLKSEGRIGSKDVWRRIAEIRPEEIVKLYRERAVGNEALTSQMEKFFNDDAFRDFRIGSNGEQLDAFSTYDKFKREFGPLIQLLRQDAYNNFQVLRIGTEGFKFTEAQIDEITRYFGGNEEVGKQKAEELRKMFVRFTSVAIEGAATVKIEKRLIEGTEQKFVKEDGYGVIHELMRDNKFEDVYTRTLLVDDALLDKLENPPEDSGITPISRFWTSEVGGDALVRNYKDTENAAKAASELLKFVYTEDPKERIKAAEQFAELTSQYNGQGGKAECVRYTVGSLLDMSKQDFIWDALGVAKLPFRRAMSKIEQIYGPQAMPMSRDELRVQLDHLHSMLVKSIDRVGKTREEIEKDEHDAENTYRELEKLLEVDPKNMLKRRAASLLFYMVFAALLESYHVLDVKVPGKK